MLLCTLCSHRSAFASIALLSFHLCAKSSLPLDREFFEGRVFIFCLCPSPEHSILPPAKWACTACLFVFNFNEYVICLISICPWSVTHFPQRMLITCKSHIAYLIYNKTDAPIMQQPKNLFWDCAKYWHNLWCSWKTMSKMAVKMNTIDICRLDNWSFYRTVRYKPHLWLNFF